jgi:WD40 repeat protein
MTTTDPRPCRLRAVDVAFVLALTAATTAALLAGPRIKVETPNGTVVLEFPDGIPDDAEVLVDGAVVKYQRKGDKDAEVIVTAGEREVMVRAGGKEFRARDKVVVPKSGKAPAVTVAFTGRDSTDVGQKTKPALGDDPVGPVLSMAGHKGTGYFLAFSPDGLSAVTLGGGDYHVWDLVKRRSVQHWNSNTAGTIWRSARPVFAGGGKVVVGGNGEEVLIYEATSGRKAGGSLKVKDSVIRWVDLSPDGTRILTGSRDGFVRLYNFKDGTKLNEFKHGSAIVHTAFSTDGKFILTASEEGKTVYLWNLEKDKQERSFDGHKDVIFAVGFSADGKKAYSASRDNTVRVWEVETGKELAKIDAGGRDTDLKCAAFCPSLRRAVTGHAWGSVMAWDLDTKERLELFTKQKRHIAAVAISPDGQHALTSEEGNEDTPLWLYRLPPKK